MAFKHTKGEWFTQIIDDQLCRRIFIRARNSDGVITLIESRNWGNFEEQKANAELMALSPELLSIAQELVDELKHDGLGALSVVDRAEKLIKKANK